MRRVALVVGTAALLTACSSTPDPAPSTVPSPELTSVSATPTPSPTPTPCPDGAYVVTAFEGQGSASGLGRGSGGDVRADFAGGTFTLGSDGTQPVSLDLGSASAQVRLDGSITGTYAGDPSALRLVTTGSAGEISVRTFGVTRRFPASTLADQLIGQDTTAQAVCDDAAGTARLTLPAASLTLSRRR